MISLPLVLRRPRHGSLYVLAWLPYIAIYQALNRFPLFEPATLDFSPLDLALPFVPDLLPLYLAYIPLFWWTAARSEDDETASRFFYGTYFQLLVCGVVWLLHPVAMPRGNFYPAESFGAADAFWRWFDPPNNCLPSLHAANCLLFIQFNWRRGARWFHTLLAVSIVASTVLVKQHYVADVLAGALVALFTVAGLRFVQVGGQASGRRQRVAAETLSVRADS